MDRDTVGTIGDRGKEDSHMRLNKRLALPFVTLLTAGMALVACGNPSNSGEGTGDTTAITAEDGTNVPKQPVRQQDEPTYEETVEQVIPNHIASDDEQKPEVDESAVAKLTEKVPQASNTPAERDSEEISEVVARYVLENHPESPMTSAELIGNGSAPSQQTPNESDYWASYVITLASGLRFGLRVTCSPSLPPYVSESDVLTVSDGLTYQVATDSYEPISVLNMDEEQAGQIDEEQTLFMLSHNDSD
jgi:hypothetical protein